MLCSKLVSEGRRRQENIEALESKVKYLTVASD